MSVRPRLFRWGAVLWAVSIAAVLVVIAGGVLLPSTKRARIDLDELRATREAESAAPATAPAAVLQSTKRAELKLPTVDLLDLQNDAPGAESAAEAHPATNPFARP